MKEKVEVEICSGMVEVETQMAVEEICNNTEVSVRARVAEENCSSK